MKFVALTACALLALGAGAMKPSDGFSQVASMLQKGMNASAEPCDDFYNYACGNWPKGHPGPWTEDSLFILTVDVINKLGKHMETLDPIRSDRKIPFPWDQAGYIFHNCMYGNEQSGDDAAVVRYLAKSLGGWPSLGTFDMNFYGGASGVNGALFSALQIGALFETSVTQNYIHPDRKMELLFQGQHLFIKDGKPQVIDPFDVANYYGELVKRFAWMSNMTLDDQQLATVEEDALQVALMSVQASNVTWAALNWTVPGNSLSAQLDMIAMMLANKYDVKSAIDRWPHIKWPEMLITLATDNVDLNQMFGSDFYVGYPSYMDWLDSVFATGDERLLRNFIMFQYASNLAPHLPALRDLHEKLSPWRDTPMIIAGRETPPTSRAGQVPTQAGRCVLQIMSKVPFLVGRLFADQSTLTQHDFNTLNEMIGLVLTSWRGMISDVPWMSAASKQNAFAKIANVARNVGWPAWIQNDAKLKEYHADLMITADDDSFTTLLKMYHFSANVALRQLGSQVNRHFWLSSPAVVNAWYYPVLNSITFPAAIMESPFFNGSYPKAFNYAHMGAVMGHELGHGFDNNGIFWGPHGEYVNGSWFDPSSKMGFEKMAECVVKEYSNFCLTLDGNKICVNGQQTLPENIADNGGLVASHRAFQAVMALGGGEAPLPSGYGKVSTLTTDQLFFLSFGNTWCSNYKPEEIIDQIHNDVHSPDQFRVLGTLRNMPSFAKAFNCPAGSMMAPKTHCHVWTA